MNRATITIHLPTHKRESLKAYGDSWRLIDEVYDANVGHYVDFLRRQGRERGFRVRTDQKDVDPVFTIEERDRQQKKAAHEWLEGLPDLWEWIT
jgi:hypothetical protein